MRWSFSRLVFRLSQRFPWVCIVFLTLLYGEIIHIQIQPLLWPNIECVNEQRCLRLLMVSDPQIIGYKNEIEGVVGSILRFDSDSHLRQTFRVARNFIRPNKISMLGDLFDEGGLTYTAVERRQYEQRLIDIFDVDSSMLIQPGDNDLGDDELENDKIFPDDLASKFLERFNQNITFNFSNLHFIQAGFIFYSSSSTNVETHSSLYDNLLRLSSQQGHSGATETLVVLSHFPWLQDPSNLPHIKYPSEIPQRHRLAWLKPRLILSSHNHYAAHYRSNRSSTASNIDLLFSSPFYQTINGTKIVSVDYNRVNETDEFVSPTCSYRMGYKEYGYSVAVFDLEKSHVHFFVLWSASRHTIFFLYSLMIAALIVTKCNQHCTSSKCVLFMLAFLLSLVVISFYRTAFSDSLYDRVSRRFLRTVTPPANVQFLPRPIKQQVAAGAP